MTSKSAQHAFQLRYSELEKESMRIVECEARKILRDHNNLDEFIMGMGVWFFTEKRVGQDSVILNNHYKYILSSALAEFIFEWDQHLKITGEAIRFTAYGEIVRNWSQGMFRENSNE